MSGRAAPTACPKSHSPAVKLPGTVKSGGLAEVLYDRMALYEELEHLVSQLFVLFAEARTSPTWGTAVVPALRAWAVA